MECYDKTQTVVQDAPKETCSLEPHLFATVRVAVDAHLVRLPHILKIMQYLYFFQALLGSHHNGSSLMGI